MNNDTTPPTLKVFIDGRKHTFVVTDDVLTIRILHKAYTPIREYTIPIKMWPLGRSFQPCRDIANHEQRQHYAWCIYNRTDGFWDSNLFDYFHQVCLLMDAETAQS